MCLEQRSKTDKTSVTGYKIVGIVKDRFEPIFWAATKGELFTGKLNYSQNKYGFHTFVELKDAIRLKQDIKKQKKKFGNSNYWLIRNDIKKLAIIKVALYGDIYSGFMMDDIDYMPCYEGSQMEILSQIGEESI
jgi:hypothetical protein